MSYLGEMWERLYNIHHDGQMDTQTFDIINSTILLIEGIEQALDLEYDPDMRYRIKQATEAINSILGL